MYSYSAIAETNVTTVIAIRSVCTTKSSIQQLICFCVAQKAICCVLNSQDNVAFKFISTHENSRTDIHLLDVFRIITKIHAKKY